MYRTTIAIAVAASVGLASQATFADTISGSAGAGWQSFPTTLNSSSNTRPYWDQISMDGPNDNIGDLMNNGTVTGSVSDDNWWGKTGPYTSNADPNFFFNRSANTSAGVLQIEFAGNANVNTVGWYDTTNPTVLHTLWAGAATPSQNESVTFSPSASYGYYLIGTNGTFYTQSSLNSSSTERTSQHFAVFADSLTVNAESYWIGIEDMPDNWFPTTEKTGDFNDFVFHVQSLPLSEGPPAPEPASLGVLTVGAIGLLIRRRK